MHILHTAVTGQSLANGGFSTSVSPGTQSNSHLHLLNSDGSLRSLISTAGDPIAGDRQIPERTMMERAYVSGQERSVFTSAKGGTPYTGIKKGTVTYQAMLDRIITGYTAAVGRGDTFTLAAMHVIHGEADSGTNRTSYSGYLEEWRSDLQVDTFATLGQSGSLPLIVSQVGNQGYSSGAAIGQLDAHRLSRLITLVGPQYQFPMYDSLHLTGIGYYKLGEMHGIAQAAVLAGDRPEPMSVRSITRDGNDILVRLHVPVLPIVLDTTIVTAQTRSGLTFTEGGSNKGFSTVIDGDTLVITPTSPSFSDDFRIRYSKGNFRDSATPTSVLDGGPLYNWLCLFDEPNGFSYELPAATGGLYDVNGQRIPEWGYSTEGPIPF